MCVGIGNRAQTHCSQSTSIAACIHPVIPLSLEHSFTSISTFLNCRSCKRNVLRDLPPHSLNKMTRLQQKKRKPFRPTLARAGEARDCAGDYEVELKKAGIKLAAYEEVFSLMVKLRDFGPNEVMLKRDTAASSKYAEMRFSKMFGERDWGNNRKHIRSGLPNGGFRYTRAKPN